MGSEDPDRLFVRLYLDHHITDRLARDLRDRGYDVLTSLDAGMERAGDVEQLEFATAQDRAIITCNIRDFMPIHKHWLESGRDHAGIIVSQQLSMRQYGLLLSRVLRLLDEITADEIRGRLIHLEQFR